MKKYLNYVIVILLMICLGVFPINITADSGFDAGYDSGVSNSSSSSSSSSSSIGNSTDNSLEDEIIGLTTSLITVVVILLLEKRNRKYIKYSEDKIKEKEKKYKITQIIIYFVIIVIITLLLIQLLELEIGTIISAMLIIIITPTYFVLVHTINTHNKFIRRIEQKNIDGEDLVLNVDLSLKEKAFEIYKDIQIAWMNLNLEPVRNLLTDEMYNMYSMQLETLKNKNQKNMMEDITFIKTKIINLKKTEEKEEIDVLLKVTCRDYIVDTRTGEVIRGDENLINEYTYQLTFIKSNNIVENKCSNCGGKLDNTSNKCQYCRSIIIRESGEYVLARKEMLCQRRK